MGRKRKESNIASVMYSYVGTDDQFDDFLKMMIHDYLSVDHPYTNQPADFVAKVETEVAKDAEGGSLQPLLENDKAAELTRNRVYELAEYLK